METVCALSVIDDKRGPSGRKMADFMMDGVCFKGLCTFFGTVRQVLVRFSDGRSRKGKVQEYNINLADKLEFKCKSRGMETCLHFRGAALNARETGIYRYRLRHARLVTSCPA